MYVLTCIYLTQTHNKYKKIIEIYISFILEIVLTFKMRLKGCFLSITNNLHGEG